jgi:hypothetical protein
MPTRGYLQPPCSCSRVYPVQHICKLTCDAMTMPGPPAHLTAQNPVSTAAGHTSTRPSSVWLLRDDMCMHRWTC